MSINQTTANAESTAALNTLQSAADAIFITNVDGQIQQAIAMGLFEITAMTNVNVNLQTVFQYYANLGYAVSFPDFMNQNGAQLPSIIQQPANFFGFNWNAFWAGILNSQLVANPARMTIRWE